MPSLDEKRIKALDALREEQDRRLIEEGVLIKREFNTVADEAQAVLDHYLPLWQSWADEETERRKSIALYSQLFALKTQVELETSLKPIEVVFAKEGDQARMLPVKRGISDDAHYEILEGVAEGVEIITGNFKAVSKELNDGSKVEPEEPKKPLQAKP